MSSRQQPDRVRILSSGSAASVEGRRRADLPLDLDDLEEDQLGRAPVAMQPLAMASNDGPLPLLRLVGLFLCCSALGGACAVASGLFGIPVQ